MSLFASDLLTAAESLLDACRARGWRMATAESCTGGLVAALLTEVAGSSDVVDRGFVTYSNAAKTALVGVPTAVIAEHGAVSQTVACEMARGALDRSDAHLSIAVTGVAGPGGGSPEKPVGLVWFATALRHGVTIAKTEQFGDLGRSAVRLASVHVALALLQSRVA